MPRIDDSSEPKRIFKKKAYRPWNLMGDDFLPLQNNEVTKEHTNSEPEKVTNKEPISNQKGIEKESISYQLDTDKEPIRYQTGTKKESLSNPISNQISNQFVIIQRITGLQKEILLHIVEDCILNGDFFTSPITIEALAQLTHSHRDTVKTATQRLINKKIISRGSGKRGKGGFAIFYVSEDIRNAVIETKKRHHQMSELVTNLVTNKEPTNAYSSSNKYITTTALPDEWKKINFSPLESIGFSEQHLQDIYSTNICDAAVVQESIYHFAFGLEQGRYKYDSPLKVLIGILRKGKAWIESNYESPKDRSLKDLVARRRAEKEKRDAIIRELVEIQFPEWRKKLTQDEIRQIVPPETLKLNLAPAITAVLRTYYIDNILLPSLESSE